MWCRTWLEKSQLANLTLLIFRVKVFDAITELQWVTLGMKVLWGPNFYAGTLTNQICTSGIYFIIYKFGENMFSWMCLCMLKYVFVFMKRSRLWVKEIINFIRFKELGSFETSTLNANFLWVIFGLKCTTLSLEWKA